MNPDYFIKFSFETGIEASDAVSQSTFKDLEGNKYFLHIDGIATNLEEVIRMHGLEDDLEENDLFKVIKKIKNPERYLLGSFVIIFFDFKNLKLKVIRDSRGTKLIYFRKINKEVFLSNNLNKLIPLANVSPNLERIKGYLSWNYNNHKNTFFEEISRLPPSHFLEASLGCIKIRKYSLSENLFESFADDFLMNFKKIFSKTIKKSMVESEGKSIAIMLSGGLDSSAIGLGISNLGYSNINSYSANFSHIKTPENQTLDERNFQENIISKVGFYHKYIELEGCSPVNSLKESIDIFSEPIAFPNIYLFMEIAKAARNDQIDILLDGHDGDVTISHGYETLYDYFIKLKLIKFLYEIFSYARIKKISQLKALKIFLKPALKKIFRMTKKREIISKGLLDETFISDENLISDNARVYLSHEEKLKNPLLVLGNEYRYIFFKSFNIENRSPFYDEHLIRFCLDLPSKFKLSKGYTRKILRQFLEDR